jgi:hypothetical protein
MTAPTQVSQHDPDDQLGFVHFQSLELNEGLNLLKKCTRLPKLAAFWTRSKTRCRVLYSSETEQVLYVPLAMRRNARYTCDSLAPLYDSPRAPRTAAVPVLLPSVGGANLTLRILANLQFGEDFEQSTLSEHREDGVLRVVDQFFKIALHIGTHEAAMGNSSSGRPDFGIGYDGTVDVAQSDLCSWSCETHATGLGDGVGPARFATKVSTARRTNTGPIQRLTKPKPIG